MYKKIVIILLCLFFVVGCKEKKEIKSEVDNTLNVEEKKLNENHDEEESSEDVISEEDMITQSGKLTIEIDDQPFIITLEDNTSVKDLIKLLPIHFILNYYDENKMTGYMPSEITSNDKIYGIINKGDLMISDGDKISLFLNDYVSTSSYTKIGHIENFNYTSKTRNADDFMRMEDVMVRIIPYF
ncbi:MAG: hypothetical protein IJ572_02375 [Bacilli bacterium]|nr:hypothetical protein [Bacilli bacterium]